jgi:hypothetical protein
VGLAGGEGQQVGPVLAHLGGEVGELAVGRAAELDLTAGLERDAGAVLAEQRDEVPGLFVGGPARVARAELLQDPADAVVVVVGDRRAVGPHHGPLKLPPDEPAILGGAVAGVALDELVSAQGRGLGHGRSGE